MALWSTEPGIGAWAEDLPGKSPRLGRDQMYVSQVSGSLDWVDDGLSNSILIAEHAGTPTAYGSEPPECETPDNWFAYGWTSLDIWHTARTARPIHGRSINKNNCDGIYAFHSVGANTVFCDGSVHFLSEATAAGVINALMTRDGGEVIDAKALQ